MGVSNAVGSERVAKIVGYELETFNALNETPNLPMSVAVFGQANTDKQGGLTNAAVQVTSEKQAGDLFGFGSQIHIQMRILRNRLTDLMGGIPTWIYPQLAPGGGAAQVDDITITVGPASAAAVHVVEINGRRNFDGASLEFSIATGDAVAVVATKIADVINNASSCPVSAVATLGVVACTTKWVGESAAELDIVIDTQDNPVALVYAVTEDTPAAGDSSAEITTSLALFGNQWNTIIVNPYLIARDSLFEDFNGVPGVVPASGRYAGVVFKPFVCLRGSVIDDTVANVVANLDKDEATIVQCPAPGSTGWTAEAAANVGVLLARQAQDSPHLDVAGKAYPDMPVPSDNMAGIYDAYNDRDLIVKSGGSTVIILNSKYQIEDLITTYHPDNETPPQFRYVRTLIQDWNIRFGYLLLEETNVVNKALVEDGVIVTVRDTIRTSQWIGILDKYFINQTERGILVEPEFATAGLQVQIGDTNPDRFETRFPYKRSGFTRIAATSAVASFNFG